MPVMRSALASRAASRANAEPAPTRGGSPLPGARAGARVCPGCRASRGTSRGRAAHARFQPRLAVEVPEMPRIGEAGSQRALVAGDGPCAAIRRLDVGREAEIRRCRTVRVAEREVALVHPQRHLDEMPAHTCCSCRLMART